MIVVDFLRPYFVTLVRVAVILAAGYIVAFLIGRLIRGLRVYVLKRLVSQPGANEQEIEKQATTIAGILGKTVKVMMFVLVAVMALRELGFDVAPIIAGASVIGVALGFGAQYLVRDMIAGFFILVENQIRVRDIAVINDIGGVVEEINLRTTVLRDLEGTVHVFPNGSINKLANRTQEFSYYLFNLSFAYRDNLESVDEILKSVANGISQEPAYKKLILAPIEILGVDQLGESAVNLKARIKTLPGKQWEVGREMNRRLKTRFEQAGFDFPVKGPRRLEILAPGTTRDELKVVIREVLDELNAEQRN